MRRFMVLPFGWIFLLLRLELGHFLVARAFRPSRSHTARRGFTRGKILAAAILAIGLLGTVSAAGGFWAQ